jgi:hypothetical protein
MEGLLQLLQNRRGRRILRLCFRHRLCDCLPEMIFLFISAQHVNCRLEFRVRILRCLLSRFRGRIQRFVNDLQHTFETVKTGLKISMI